MILSHKLKLIFFAIPKTGTHAIREALRKEMGAEDEEQVGLFIQKKFSDERIAQINHGHIKCQELKPVLDNSLWHDYFKFAIVRNPWDRYISFCAFMNRNNPAFQRDPKMIVHRIIDRPKARERILFRPQHEFICDQHGDLMVDFVGRFENLQDSFNQVAKQNGFVSSSLNQINGSEHQHYSSYFDDELKEKVADFYKRDVELFGYQYDDGIK